MLLVLMKHDGRVNSARDALSLKISVQSTSSRNMSITE